MLNAMPLPIGPTEIPGGAAKPEINRKPHDSGTPGKNDASFASTLEAIHKKGETPSDGLSPKSDDTSGAQSASEEKDTAHEAGEGSVSTDGGFILMTQEQTIPDNASGFKISGSNSVANPASETTSPVPETESLDAAMGLQEKTIAAPNPNTPDLQKKTAAVLSSETSDFVVPRQSTVTNAGPQGGVNVHQSDQDMLLQENTKTLKAGQGFAEAIPSNTGTPVSPGDVDPNAQASQVMETTMPDKKMTPKAQRNAMDGLVEKAHEVDATLSKLGIDEGEPQTSNKEHSASHLRYQGTADRKTTPETPTPGQFKAEGADSHTVRPQTADDANEGSKTFGAKMSETPIHMMNDEASPMAGRPGTLDPALTFSSSPSDGKIATAPGHTTAAPVVTPDVFHQENFHQLVERALFTVRGEHSEARIALKPDHLGHVQMRIVTENNLVTIKIVTESPVTRDLIEANANQLKTELQQQGLNVGNIEVSVSDERHDAYRQARQRESFLRKVASQGYASPEENGERFENRPGQIRPDRNSLAGIDYFA